MRLFVALPVPENIRNQLVSLCHGLPGARWVPPENFHMTLRFIGDVEMHQAEDLDDNLMRIDASPVDIQLEDIGWFGTKNKVSSVIVKARKTESLVHLQKKVESAVVRAGFKPEDRKFTPHVTLARMKDGRLDALDEYCRRHGMPIFPPYQADRFILYSSFLSHTGAIYTPEEEYLLSPHAIPSDCMVG